MRTRGFVSFVAAMAMAAGFQHPLAAQVEGALERGLRVDRLVAEPASLELVRGDEGRLVVRALDGAGEVVDAVIRVTGPRRALRIASGTVTALEVGEHRITATVALPAGAERDPPTLEIPVSVEWPALERVEVSADPGTLYVGTVLKHRARALHGDGTLRPDAEISWASSDPEVASVDGHGNVTAHAEGSVEIVAEAEGVREAARYDVRAFPAERLEVTADVDEVVTGDVVHLRARALDAAGREVDDLPVSWGFDWEAGGRDIIAPGATATVSGGTFTAEAPGEYTVFALSGPLSDRITFSVDEREVVREVRLLGQGRVDDYHTSDFWIWEGVDGRDWALTGTWGADGWAYLWDVTDPASLIRTDSAQVDARTVNDVKVSPDGRYATLTREGASNRRNGLVILDLSDPGKLSIASVVDEGLTGGVHNAFPAEDYVYALSAGEKYLIIDMADLAEPRVVGEVQHEDCRIHDVWVHDGIAYSAQWGCGLIVYDVGNGRWGGSPDSPEFVSQFRTPGGRTHAVYPYYQEETGIFYVYLGDEIIGRRGMAWGGQPSGPYTPGDADEPVPEQTAGYVHIVDFSDPADPEMVARYQVPEYGTHNIWVENDVLYQAYYEGGLRVVDVSGELRGNLAEQGREMAVFKPFDPYGHIRNAPMVWSAMPFKGRIFLSDHNSGLWSVELQPPESPPVS